MHMGNVIDALTAGLLGYYLVWFGKRVTETINYEQAARCGKIVIAAYIAVLAFYLMSIVLMTGGAWMMLKGLTLHFPPCLVIGGVYTASGVVGLFQSLTILRKNPQPVAWTEVFGQLKVGFLRYFSLQPQT